MITKEIELRLMYMMPRQVSILLRILRLVLKNLKKRNLKKLSYDEIPDPKLFFVEEYNNAGVLWKKDLYVYDDNGKITQVKSMDNKDKPQFNYLYTYDENGNETSRTTLDKNDKQVQKISYTYDTKGM